MNPLQEVLVGSYGRADDPESLRTSPANVTAVTTDGASRSVYHQVVWAKDLPGDYPDGSFTASPGTSCASVPCTVTFDAGASSDEDGITKYRWDLDGDYILDAEGASVSHTYNTPGGVNVYLEVTDGAGNRSTVSKQLTLANPSPVANFTVSTPQNMLLPITFDASSSSDNGSITTYEWDFDNDGSFDASSSAPTVAHIFWEEGSSSSTAQNVRLRVTDNLGATAIKELSFSPANHTESSSLTARFTQQASDSGLRVSFDASTSSVSGASITEYAWDFDGDGVIDRTSTSPTATYTFERAAGTVWLRVTDSKGRRSVASAAVGSAWQAPTVVLHQDPVDTSVTSTDRVRTFTFDAMQSHSNVPGATIVDYEWQFKHDWQPVPCWDNFRIVCDAYDAPERSGAGKGVVLWDFTGPLNRTATLKVTDSAGLSTTKDIPVVLTQGTAPTADAGGPYTCQMLGSLSSGCQLTGPVTASGSSDAGGSISARDWFFAPSRLREPLIELCNDPHGGIDCSGSLELNHPTWQSGVNDPLTYLGAAAQPYAKTPIEPTIQLRVKDNEGNVRFEDAHVNQVPYTQSIHAGTFLPGLGYTGAYSAQAGIPVQLTAHKDTVPGSFGGVGSVDSWAWDVNNDGTVDATTSGATPTLNWTFPSSGTFPVKVTATTKETGRFGDQNGTVWTQTPSTVATVNVASSYTGTVLADSPAGYWRLGETSGTVAADSSGNAKNGTFTGNFILKGENGALLGESTQNSAVRFQGGATSLVTLPNMQLSAQNNLTMEGWIKTTSGSTAPVYLFNETNSSNWSYFRVNQGKLRYYRNLLTPTEGGGAWSRTYDGTRNVNDGNWHHIAAVQTAGSVTLYVDGTADGTWNETQKHQALASTDIGKSTTATIDEPAVYFTALTGAKIASHVAAQGHVPTVANAGADQTVYTDSVVTFNGSASTGDGLSYSWDFKDDTPVGTGATVEHTFTTGGSRLVELTVTDAYGRTVKDTVAINVKVVPVARAGNDVTANTGTPVTLNATGSAGTGLSYSWDFKDGTAAGTGATVNHTFTTPGTYDVKLTVNDGQRTSEDTVRVTVQVVPPVASAAASTNVTRTGSSITLYGSGSTGTGLSYSWDFKDGTPAGTGTQVSHTWSTPGTYDVKLTVKDIQNRTSTTTRRIVIGNSLTQCNYCGEVMADTPLAYWKFDEASGTSRADASGNGHTGTLGGTTAPTRNSFGALAWLSGSLGYPAAGNSQTAITPGVSIADRQNVTVESWVNASTAQTGLLRLVTDNADNTSAAAGNTYLGVNGGKAQFGITLTNPVDGQPVTKTYTGTTTVNNGAWHHLAVVRTPNTVTLYVDGKPDGTWNETQLHQAFGNTFLGQRWAATGTGTYWTDEPAIYDSALDADRIKLHYAFGKDDAYIPPVADAGADAVKPIDTLMSFQGTALAGTSPYTYLWDFGDGQTSTNWSVNHAYGSTGTYTVTFTVTDKFGVTSTDTKTVTIE
ncbi:PKD domain-containing protein [Streptomyces sp. NPDC015492]|uniref:PKD domain-containing protein n=1 Tax=Streptomyces sp. NPDC015492 TaxID=3364958 RepID=UPI0036FC5225